MTAFSLGHDLKRDVAICVPIGTMYAILSALEDTAGVPFAVVTPRQPAFSARSIGRTIILLSCSHVLLVPHSKDGTLGFSASYSTVTLYLRACCRNFSLSVNVCMQVIHTSPTPTQSGSSCPLCSLDPSFVRVQLLGHGSGSTLLDRLVMDIV